MNYFFTFCSIVALIATSNFTNAQWQQTNGPHGGVVSCYAKNDDGIYVGTQYGGVFRSTNNGGSWQARNNGLRNYSINCMAADGDHLYVGPNIGGVSFYHSTDGGNNWIVMEGLWTSYVPTTIAASGQDIYVGTAGGGNFASHDGGQTWASAMIGIVPYMYFSTQQILIVGDIIYCTVNGKLYSSIDGAASWSLLEEGFPEDAGVYQLNVIGDNLFAATNAGLFTSNNDGQNWIDISTNLPEMPYGFGMSSSGNFLYIAGGYGEGIFYSNDNGFTWTQLNEGWQNTIVTFYALSAGNLLVQSSSNSPDYLSTDAPGLYYTQDNGSTWENVTHEITSTYCLSLVAQGNNVFTGTYATGIFKTNNEGDDWTDVGLHNWHLRTLETSGNTLLAAGDWGISRSVDAGATWEYASQGLTNSSVQGFAHIDDNIFAATADGVFISTNDGQSWAQQNNGISTPYILCMHAIDDVIYAGTQDGIFISTNYGNSWESINNGLPDIASVYQINHIGTTLAIALYNYGIYTSQDNGQNWINVNTSPVISSLEVSGNILFAGTRFDYDVSQVGVIVSYDLGATWQDANQGLNNNMVFDLAIAGDYIYAATLGSGVFKRPLAEFISENISEEISANILIYPNPASDNITITIPSRLIGSYAIITNELGQQVRRIGNVTSTNFQVDCLMLAAGFYVVKIGDEKVKFVVR